MPTTNATDAQADRRYVMNKRVLSYAKKVTLATHLYSTRQKEIPEESHGDDAFVMSDSSADQLDQALMCTQIFNKMVFDAFQQQKARQTREAEERKQQGLGGICEDCGNPIPLARLKVNPEATRCIYCQANYEKRGIQVRPWCC